MALNIVSANLIDSLVKSRHSGEPRIRSGAGTGVHWVCNWPKELDSGFRRNDRKRPFPTFYGGIHFGLTTVLSYATYAGAMSKRLFCPLPPLGPASFMPGILSLPKFLLLHKDSFMESFMVIVNVHMKEDQCRND